MRLMAEKGKAPSRPGGDVRRLVAGGLRGGPAGTTVAPRNGAQTPAIAPGRRAASSVWGRVTTRPSSPVAQTLRSALREKKAEALPGVGFFRRKNEPAETEHAPYPRFNDGSARFNGRERVGRAKNRAPARKSLRGRNGLPYIRRRPGPSGPALPDRFRRIEVRRAAR